MRYKKPKDAKYYYYNGFPTSLVIYRDGRIYNYEKNKFTTGWTNPNGYHYINIPGFNAQRAVHQIVAETFIPNPDKKPCVNHIDGNKDNNSVDNLEWITYRENNLHAYALGLHKPNTPDKVKFTKYTESQIEAACKLMETGMMLKQVEAQTGVPVRTLGEIRSGRIWKSISYKYTFPEKHYVSSNLYDAKFREDIYRLWNEGKKPTEIMDALGVGKDNPKLRKAIWDITGRLKKGLNDHRKTTRDYTLESSRVRNNYISETEGTIDSNING